MNKDLINARKVIIKFRYLIVSILAVLILFLILYFSFYQVTIRTLSKNNTSLSTTATINREVLDTFLLNQTTQIYFSDQIESLRNAEKLTNFERISGLRALNQAVAVGNFIHSIYLYNGKLDYIFSTVDHDRRYVSNSTELFMDHEAVELFKSKTPTRGFRPVLRSLDTTGNTDKIHLYSYIIKNEEQQSGIMINVPSEELNKIIFGSYQDSFILDNELNIIAMQDDSDTALIDKIREVGLEKLDGYRRVKTAGRDLICFYSYEKNYDYYYVRFSDYDEVFGSLSLIRNIVYVLFFTTIAFVSFIAITILLRVYFPFQKLTSVLKESSDDTLTMDQLTDRLDQLIASSKNEDHLKESVNKMLKGEAIYNILSGSETKIEETIENYNLNLDYNHPVLPVLVTSFNTAPYLSIAEEAGIRAEGAAVGQNSYLLLQGDDIDLESLGRNFLARKSSEYILFGKLCSTWEELPSVYFDLDKLLERRILEPKKHISSTSRLLELDSNIKDVNEEIRQLTNFIKKGQSPSSIVSRLNRIFTLLENKTYRTTLTSYFTLYQTILQIADDSEYEEKSMLFNQTLNRMKDESEVRTIITNAYREVSQKFRHEKISQKQTLITQITDIAGREYNNSALCSQYIADKLRMSCTYICRQFKASEGISIEAYINKTRLEKSKALLRDRSLAIRDAAIQSGFSNPQYYYVLFKKETGQTPKEYRDSMS
ncbi:MAG: helix-turn-helix transcriptional regulator [Spirochaetales bacterium]|nr:helix-turn-helix transcriptional regulator [Spirochaetales bacterium]